MGAGHPLDPAGVSTAMVCNSATLVAPAPGPTQPSLSLCRWHRNTNLSLAHDVVRLRVPQQPPHDARLHEFAALHVTTSSKCSPSVGYHISGSL